MNASTRIPIALALLLALVGTGCTEVANDLANQAQQTLQAESLPLTGSDGAPRAELTAQGDLLIDGVAVPMSAAQRASALAYRAEVLAVAEIGMAMGKQGVAIAGDALALAAAGIFGGETQGIEARIEAKDKAMEAGARTLCERLNALAAAQKQLIAVLPEFKPYAKEIKVTADCAADDTTEGAETPTEAAEPTISV